MLTGIAIAIILAAIAVAAYLRDKKSMWMLPAMLSVAALFI